MIDTGAKHTIFQTLVTASKLTLSTSMTFLISRMPSQIYRRQSSSPQMEIRTRLFIFQTWEQAMGVDSSISASQLISRHVCLPKRQLHKQKLHTLTKLSMLPDDGQRHHIFMATYHLQWMDTVQP